MKNPFKKEKPQPVQRRTEFLFEPQKDIKAFELAQCIKHLFGVKIDMETMREPYMRHFTYVGDKEQPQPQK